MCQQHLHHVLRVRDVAPIGSSEEEHLACAAMCQTSRLNGSRFVVQGMVDLTGIYRIWNPKYRSYSVFSQDHLCRVLLGFDTSGSTHDAVRPIPNLLTSPSETSLPPSPTQIACVQWCGRLQQAADAWLMAQSVLGCCHTGGGCSQVHALVPSVSELSG